VLAHIQVHQDMVSAVSWSLSGSRVMVGTTRGRVRFYELVGRKLEHVALVGLSYDCHGCCCCCSPTDSTDDDEDDDDDDDGSSARLSHAAEDIVDLCSELLGLCCCQLLLGASLATPPGL
jgi:hypothetical protein